MIKCPHVETSYCSVSKLPDGRVYCAEICICGILREFRVAETQDSRLLGASASLLPVDHRNFISSTQAAIAEV